MNYWLMKTEPSTFGVDHLAACANQTTAWDGVRNYQVRNMLRAEFKRGDLALLYHSSCPQPGIVAVMEVVRTGYPDKTQFDARDHHYDPDSKRDNPRWYGVDVKLKRRLKRLISLEELRDHKQLRELKLLQRGSRLSVVPVSEKEWNFILGLE
jgi:predicted RNA-binding protein with PUA-like domain